MRFTSKLLGALLLLLSVAAGAETLSYTTYYHNDHLGSPVAATDEQGAVLWRAHFRPYGERQEDPKNTNFGSVGYTGHTQDADSGMVYMQARYYDPLIGRFMAVDPVGVNPNATTTFNRYAYANNNPHRFVDPNGESGVTAFGGLLSESGQFLMGNGFDGAMVAGALADGYNGEGDGFASAAFDDATSFIPAGAVGGVLIKLSRLSKATKGKGVTNPEVGKLARPQRPEGMTQSEFGANVIGWGKGPQGALNQIKNVNSSAVAKMKEQGLTRDMAKQWRDFYSNEFKRNNNNTTAENRVKLMDKIIGKL